MTGDVDFWAQSDDGRFGADISTREDGCFSYTVWKWHDPDPDNPNVEPCWTVARQGGVYAEQAAVEQDARVALREASKTPPTPFLPAR